MKYTFHDSCSILPRNHKSVQKPKEQEAKTTKAKKNKKLRSREDKSRKSHESNKSQTSQKKVNKSQKNHKSHKSNKNRKSHNRYKSHNSYKSHKSQEARLENKKKGQVSNNINRLKGHCTAHARPVFKTTYRQTIGWLNPSNTGLWLLLRNFSFGFLHFVLSQPDPFPCVWWYDESKTIVWALKSTQAYISLHATAICKIYRKISKESPMVRGITHKKVRAIR